MTPHMGPVAYMDHSTTRIPSRGASMGCLRCALAGDAGGQVLGYLLGGEAQLFGEHLEGVLAEVGAGCRSASGFFSKVMGKFWTLVLP